MTLLVTIGRFSEFCADVTRATISNPPPLSRVIEEGSHIGWRSLPILLIISGFVGTSLALQGYNAFAPLGGERMVGMFVALAGVRELAPIMVASMVAAKAGTEMASELAVMRIQEQIDALEVMAINPYWFLVTPRIAGILLVIPALTMISILTLLSASWAASVYQLGLNSHEFIGLLVQTMRPLDLLFCMIKSLFFGSIICLVSCFYGFTCSDGPAGVGAATNSAVVVSAVWCAAFNYLLSELMFG